MTITLNNEELTTLVRNGIRNYDLAGSAEIKFQAKKGGEVEAIITQSLLTEQDVKSLGPNNVISTTIPKNGSDNITLFNDTKESKINMPTESSQEILDKLTDITPEGVK